MREMFTKSCSSYRKGGEVVREFDTGATRDTVEGKFDFEGFLSPSVLNRYAEYMNKHRKQADGKLRDSDNWQKGIPLNVYMKSAYRHFFSLWASHRHVDSIVKEDIEESLCALLFNTMGYLHEYLKAKQSVLAKPEPELYAPQSGDVVAITVRSCVTIISYPQLYEALKKYYQIGVIIKKTSGGSSLLYVTSIGGCEFNIYIDEMTLLKRES